MTTFGRNVVLLIAIAFVSYYSYMYDSIAPTKNGIVTILEPEMETVIPQLVPEDIEIVDATEFLVQIDTAELDCLQKNIYFEAGNQSKEGKEAVALVTLNRMRANHYPNSVCGVVYQRKQFSWTFLKRNHNPPLDNVLEKRQWETSGEVALAALRGEVESVDIGNSTHYHATYVNPSWSRSARMEKVAKVGTHIFYVDTKLRFKDGA